MRSESASSGRVTGLRQYVRRFWFEFGGPRTALPSGAQLRVDRADAERLLREAAFGGSPLPPVERVVEDVDIRELDARHVIPNMGDPTVRGVWFPRP